MKQQCFGWSVAVKQVLVLALLSCIVLSFDFDTGNSGREVLIPAIIDLTLKDVSPRASDPSLILRITTMTTLAWFDAIAPYHPTAVGIYTQHSHRLTESTNRNKNIALFYSGYHVARSYFPKRKKELDELMTKFGLNPDLDSSDVNTPEGLGIIAAKNLLAHWLNDGMNQLGDKLTKHQDKVYNRFPYFDYTGYAPVNTAY